MFRKLQLVPLMVHGIVSALAIELMPRIPITAAKPQTQAGTRPTTFPCMGMSFLRC